MIGIIGIGLYRILTGFSLVAIVFLFALPVSAETTEGQVQVEMLAVPTLPGAVQKELIDIFRDTLTNILFSGQSSADLRNSDPVEVASAIQTGINIVIEPKGYTVGDLLLNLDSTPALARITVHPTGWTPENPHTVTDVKVRLSEKGLDPFWIEKFQKRLSDNSSAVLEFYRQYLLGLPDAAVDGEWALNLVLPELIKSDPASSLFSQFKIDYSITLGPVADVTLSLEPSDDIVQLIRPRMYSRTICNLILDRFRERLLSKANFLEGIPSAEITASSNEIADALTAKLSEDPLARRLGAHVKIRILVLTDEPVVLVTTKIESRLYDLELEGFVDFGNESRDATELEGRIGALLGEKVEFFVNLNYFTNDSTLDTDIAVGLAPTDSTFVSVGYDLSRKDPKYFYQQDLGNGFRLRGEIFKDDDLNEFGLTYQFLQYLSGGVYSNGNNEFWVRAIIRL